MSEIILDFYKKLYENTLQKLIDRILYNKVVKILGYAIDKGFDRIVDLKNNLTSIFEKLFRHPTNKIVPV